MRPLLVLVLVSVFLPVLVWVAHPWPLALRWVDPQTTAYMDHRSRVALAAGDPFEASQAWIPLGEIPTHLQRAVLIAEDDRFYEHRGVDWEALAEEVRYSGSIPPRLGDADDRIALAEALAYLRDHRDAVRGRSTITQQLARNLYLTPDRSFFRKAQELIIAQRLEWFLPKDRIFEIYLNVAELGPGIFGVEAASHEYFGVSAREINNRQAASLAATLPHPLTSNPSYRPAQMGWRRDLILRRMLGPPASPSPVPIPAPTIESPTAPAGPADPGPADAIEEEPTDPGATPAEPQPSESSTDPASR